MRDDQNALIEAAFIDHVVNYERFNQALSASRWQYGPDFSVPAF
jgi:hypothetical protein